MLKHLNLILIWKGKVKILWEMLDVYYSCFFISINAVQFSIIGFVLVFFLL